MFVVTNRNLRADKKGLEQLGETPNPQGPNELRLVEVAKEGDDWKIEILPDKLDRQRKKAVGLPVSKEAYASQYAARKILQRVQKERRNILFFIHGYNNNMQSVLERAAALADNFNVEVIPFSWPANGGGARGTLSYLSDKRDANASVGALSRVLVKIQSYLNEFNAGLLEESVRTSLMKFPNNPERRDKFIAEQVEEGCPFKISMLLHSMGAYLYKGMLKSRVYAGTRLIFDNVVMAAPDTNNADHAEWVDKIQCRNRIYITLNENDFALRAFRVKAGQEQLARLGHYPFNLNAERAVYVDFTEAAHVEKSHAYFEGDALQNPTVMRFFMQALNGERAEPSLHYNAAKNTHTP